MCPDLERAAADAHRDAVHVVVGGVSAVRHLAVGVEHRLPQKRHDLALGHDSLPVGRLLRVEHRRALGIGLCTWNF